MVTSDLYAACLILTGRPVLVVGAGPIALEKIEGLLRCGAEVTVVAPDAIEEVESLALAGRIAWEQRLYREEDLEGRLLVVGATSTRKVNVAVFEDAERRSMLVNVVDVPDLCNFILPAVARTGPVLIAVSTSGASPALAKRLRREMSEVAGPEYATLAEMLDSVRDWARSTLPTYDDRKEFFSAIVDGEPDPIELLRAGDRERVEALIREAMGRAGKRLP